MIPLILAPLLTQGLNLLTNAIMVKGKEWVEEKAGVKLDDPSKLSQEQLLQLKQFEMDHEEELLKLQLTNNQLSATIEIAYLADVASARSMQAEALRQEDVFSKRYIYHLTTGLLVFSAVYILAITFVDVPQKNLRFVDTVLGFLLGTVIACAIQFFYGSSKSSKDKNETIRSAVEGVK